MSFELQDRVVRTDFDATPALKSVKKHKVVVLALASYANDDGSQCFPAQKNLAIRAGSNSRSVQRALAALIAAGIVEIERAGTGRDTNHYRIITGHFVPATQRDARGARQGRKAPMPEPRTMGDELTRQGRQADASSGAHGAHNSVSYSINKSISDSVRADHLDLTTDVDRGKSRSSFIERDWDPNFMKDEENMASITKPDADYIVWCLDRGITPLSNGVPLSQAVLDEARLMATFQRSSTPDAPASREEPEVAWSR